MSTAVISLYGQGAKGPFTFEVKSLFRPSLSKLYEKQGQGTDDDRPKVILIGTVTSGTVIPGAKISIPKEKPIEAIVIEMQQNRRNITEGTMGQGIGIALNDISFSAFRRFKKQATT